MRKNSSKNSPALSHGNAGTVNLYSNTQFFFPSIADLSLLAESYDFTDEEKSIYLEIIESLSTSNKVPFDWSAQEVNYLSKNPKDKWLEYIFFRFKLTEYPKRMIESDFPIYLKIEPVSSCNLRCVMCFQVDKTFTRKPYMGTMDFGMFKNVVDEAHVQGTKAVTLGSRGEPTLHPKLPEMLSYMRGKFIEVKLITNATKLTEKLVHSILQNDVDMLVFSIDAHEKDLYERIRVNGSFENVFENIRKFKEIKEAEYPNSRITTRVSGVKFDQQQDIQKFIEFWSPYIDEVGMKEAAVRWNTYENDLNEGNVKPCLDLWQTMYVWFDGVTNPCDSDYKSVLSPGSFKAETLKEIWQGENLSAIRKLHKHGGRSSLMPCDRCGVHVE